MHEFKKKERERELVNAWTASAAVCKSGAQGQQYCLDISIYCLVQVSIQVQSGKDRRRQLL